MPSISVPLGELRDRYDIVVIGSGYGGGVAALRLSQKYKQAAIALFERGREWHPGGFPGTTASAFAEMQFDTGRKRYGKRTGLFDLRADDDMMVLVGCGLGGTSLINANVMIEPLPNVFDAGWPAALTRQLGLAPLEVHFKQAREVLRPGPLPPDILPLKVRRMGEADSASTTAERPDIAVSFHTATPDLGRVSHNRCTLCGNCVTGCNHGAKKTVDRNYLAEAAWRPAKADEAERQGVDIFCELETRSIECVDGEWHLHVRLTDSAWRTFEAGEFVVRASAVVLAAGTLGSTEILLRSRERHKLTLSPALGTRFSGNGDVIAFSYDGREAANAFGYGARLPVHPTVGPSITSMLDERAKASGLMIQDAAIPGALATVMRCAARVIAWRTRLPQAEAGDFRLLRLWHELSSLLRGAGHGVLSRTQTFLVMSRDSADGRLVLSPATGRLRIQWPGIGSADLFVQTNVRLRELARSLKGRFVANPVWNARGRRRLVSVHPLGGCVMADSPNDGVVNDRGQVYTGSGEGTHQGLYVCDGSIVPVALGANPALTIAALAERVMARASIGQLERKGSAPNPKPRTRVQPALSESNEPGIVYGERLTGTVSWGRARSSLELMLHISADSFERLLAASGHEARVIGVAHTPNLRDNRSWTIVDGWLNVHVTDPRQPDTRLMLYRLELAGEGGGRVCLRGHKTINRASCRKDLWRAISGFPFVLHAPEARLGGPWGASAAMRLHDVRPHDDEFGMACDWVDVSTGQREPRACERYDAIAIATGTVGNTFADALAMLRSVRITKQAQRIPRLTAMARYAWFFARPVLGARFSTLERTDRGDPFCRPKLTVPPASDSHCDDAKPGLGPRFKLTKYAALGAGLSGAPVLLAPGFGMSTDAFHSKGHGDSIVEFFRSKGHDVWLLDYRGSDKLDISLTQFSLDDLVEDFADAIALVHDRSQKGTVRVLAHCVASLVMSMLLLDKKFGPRVAPHLESVILSQSLAFMNQPFVNRLKAWLRLPEVLRLLRFNPVLTSDDDLRASWRSRLFDRLLRFYPTQEHCSSSVCRRTIFMYGEVIRHEHISSGTHERIFDFFDRANLTSFAHIAHMIRAGKIVNRYGENVYLRPENGRAITTPLTFFQGERNRLFRRRGGIETERWFRSNGTSDLFRLVEMPRYGHLDNFIGEHAACDVFPKFDEAFTRMATLAAPPA